MTPAAVPSRTRSLVPTVAVLALLGAGSWALPHVGTLLVVRQPIAAPDAILSLGSHEWERLPVAAAVAAREPVAQVLLTEPVSPSPANCNNCGARVGWLQGLGVGSHRIIMLAPPVTNTYDEAQTARAYCDAHGFTRLVIVTSPYHTRRTLATFRAVFRDSGITLGVEPALAHSTARPDDWWARSEDRWYVTYEWAALAWYAVRHGINPLGGRPQKDVA